MMLKMLQNVLILNEMFSLLYYFTMRWRLVTASTSNFHYIRFFAVTPSPELSTDLWPSLTLSPSKLTGPPRTKSKKPGRRKAQLFHFQGVNSNEPVYGYCIYRLIPRKWKSWAFLRPGFLLYPGFLQ